MLSWEARAPFFHEFNMYLLTPNVVALGIQIGKNEKGPVLKELTVFWESK